MGQGGEGGGGAAPNFRVPHFCFFFTIITIIIFYFF